MLTPKRSWLRAARLAAAPIIGVVGLSAAGMIATTSSPANAASLPTITLPWSVTLDDAPNGIDLSSPNVAELPGGPAVVVGDGDGYVYAYNLATGNRDWAYANEAPIESTPSVAPTNGSPYDSVFVGVGYAGDTTIGGYQAISPTGGDQWFVQERNPPTDPQPTNGVDASLAVGDLQGGTDLVAGSLGEEEYACQRR